MQLLVKDKKTFPPTYWLQELGLTAADLLGSGVRKCVEKATILSWFEKVLIKVGFIFIAHVFLLG